MRLKVRLPKVCDWRTPGEVIDADTGRRIDGIREIRIRAGQGMLTEVELTLIDVEIDSDIEAKT